MTLTEEQIEAALAERCGSEVFYRHPLSNMVYTEGVKLMADLCGAYWLIDAIASYQPTWGSKADFQVWLLKVDRENQEAVLTMQEDSDQPVRITQKIEFTDFPLPKMKLWVEGNTLLLPSEH
jgi:hypothetical protein